MEQQKVDDRRPTGDDSSHEEGEFSQENVKHKDNGQGHINKNEGATRHQSDHSSQSRFLGWLALFSHTLIKMFYTLEI